METKRYLYYVISLYLLSNGGYLWCPKNHFKIYHRMSISGTRLDLLFLKAHKTSAEAKFFQADGRLVKVKLSLFSTVLDNSPLTSIYFTTFEKKRKVRSPLTHNQTFWFLVNFTFFWLYEYLCLRIIIHLEPTHYARISKITTRQCKCDE